MMCFYKDDNCIFKLAITLVYYVEAAVRIHGLTVEFRLLLVFYKDDNFDFTLFYYELAAVG